MVHTPHHGRRPEHHRRHPREIQRIQGHVQRPDQTRARFGIHDRHPLREEACRARPALPRRRHSAGRDFDPVPAHQPLGSAGEHD